MELKTTVKSYFEKTEKIFSFGLIIFFTGLLLIKGIQPVWNTVHSDFANYYVSAKLIADNAPLEKIYDNDWFQQKIHGYGIDTIGKFAPFPPITAFFMLPLTSFEPITAQRIFTIINLAFLGLGVLVIKKMTRWSWYRCCLIILLSGLGLINNIAFGQMYWIMTVFILIAIWCQQNNRSVLAAIIFGLFTSLKYFPIVFVGGYFLLGVARWGEGETLKKNTDMLLAVYTGLIVMALIFFQLVFFGADVMREFVHSAFLPHLDGELKGQGLYSFQFQSWDVFLRNLFVADQQFNPNPMVNWPAGKEFFKFVMLSILCLCTGFVLLKFRSDRTSRNAIFLALPALAALVALPASATYHFILLLIPLVLLLKNGLLNQKFRIILFILFLLIGIIPYGLAFKLAGYLGLAFAFPRLILVTLFFFGVVLSLSLPNRSSDEIASA